MDPQDDKKCLKKLCGVEMENYSTTTLLTCHCMKLTNRSQFVNLTHTQKNKHKFKGKPKEKKKKKKSNIKH